MIERHAGLLLIGLWMTTAAVADSPAARLVTVEREVSAREALHQVAAERDCRHRQMVEPAAWLLVHHRRAPGRVYSVMPAPGGEPVVPGSRAVAEPGHCDVPLRWRKSAKHDR
jgi:hypothetical protein